MIGSWQQMQSFFFPKDVTTGRPTGSEEKVRKSLLETSGPYRSVPSWLNKDREFTRSIYFLPPFVPTGILICGRFLQQEGQSYPPYNHGYVSFFSVLVYVEDIYTDMETLLETSSRWDTVNEHNVFLVLALTAMYTCVCDSKPRGPVYCTQQQPASPSPLTPMPRTQSPPARPSAAA